MKDTKSFEELNSELRTNSEYRKAERAIKPYYDLALEIIRLRAALGLTQKDLAQKAGTYQSRISKIESSEFDIRLSTLISIAEAMDTQVSIKLVPTLEAYYAKRERLSELHMAQVVTESAAVNATFEEPEHVFSVPTQIQYE